MTACSGKGTEPETEESAEQPKEKSNTSGLLLFLFVVLAGGGDTFYYFKVMKPKQDVKGGTDFNAFDFDYYDEDKSEPDDADGNASKDERSDNA